MEKACMGLVVSSAHCRHSGLIDISVIGGSAAAEGNGRRGARQMRRGSSRRELVYGGSGETRTMMQPCASAAKLRGGGPILHRGSARVWPVWRAAGVGKRL